MPDLNLESIFRTPKDFSRVNFDHFELLERTNFDDQNEAIETSDNHSNAEDKTARSIANAQVMLRIGGENIRDCNRVTLGRPEDGTSRYSQPPIYNNYPYVPPVCTYIPPQTYTTLPAYYYNPQPLVNYQPPYQYTQPTEPANRKNKIFNVKSMNRVVFK